MKKDNLLHTLSLPGDLKNLSTDELETLAEEIREELLEIGDACGGHLASNLGVVELTLVLHTLLESPRDKMVFDTSHQTYVHKILTGRLDRMRTIRQDKGLSGFAKIAESEHDSFGAGHASTALSAALGMAQGRDLKKDDYTVVSIVGDSSWSGGMCFEALNNIEKLDDKSNFICILNDNNMAISPPVGNMATYLTKVRTSALYDKATHSFESIVDKIPKIGEPLRRRIEKAVSHSRDVLIDSSVGVIFEEFGFKYLGPIDGHNIPVLMAALKYAKTYQGPIMVHIITQKGKGHAPSEADPVKYHGVSPKKLPTTVVEAPKPKTYTQIFGQSVIDICNKQDDVVVITPAMEGGSGLTPFKEAHPGKFFDVGIAEEHAVTFCGGLVQAGIRPILAIYSTFLQRGYDQMVHDICLQNLPVVFALDRSGIVGEDGPTHHGLLDYTFELPIPNLTILAPKDGTELTAMMDWSVTHDQAVSVRYPKGPTPSQDGQIKTPVSNQKAEVMVEFSETRLKQFDVLLIGVGSMAWPSYEAAKILRDKGINCAVINPRFVKPLDTKTIGDYINRSEKVVVIEEGYAVGGVFHYILNQFSDHSKPLSDWHQIAFPDHFIDHGKIKTLMKQYGLTTEGIAEKVEAWVTQETKLTAPPLVF